MPREGSRSWKIRGLVEATLKSLHFILSRWEDIGGLEAESDVIRKPGCRLQRAWAFGRGCQNRVKGGCW